MAWIEGDTVKTVGQIDFEEKDWSMVGFGADDFLKESFEGATKLHGFLMGAAVGGAIDSAVCVIHNDPGAALALWDTANW